MSEASDSRAGAPPELARFERAMEDFVSPAERPLARLMLDAGESAMALAQTSFSWRNSGLLSAVGDQQGANCCTSFAISAAVEFQYRRSHGTDVRLAPGFIHHCLGRLDDRVGYDLTLALEDCRNHGIARGFSGDYPYPLDECGRSDRVALASWGLLDGPEEALNWMAEHGPVVADLRIDKPSFRYLAPDTVYIPPASAAFIHTVLVVGYDFEAGWALIQNSMGPAWCDEGFGRVRLGAGGGFLTTRGACYVTV